MPKYERMWESVRKQARDSRVVLKVSGDVENDVGAESAQIARASHLRQQKLRHILALRKKKLEASKNKEKCKIC